MFRRKTFIDGRVNSALKETATLTWRGERNYLSVKLVSMPYGRVTEPRPGHRVWFLVSFFTPNAVTTPTTITRIAFDGDGRYALVFWNEDDKNNRLVVDKTSPFQLTTGDRELLLEIISRFIATVQKEDDEESSC